MNNKSIIILIFFIGLVSIMTISIWGTLPENNNLPPIEKIEVSAYDEFIEGSKFIDVTDIVTEDNNIFIIKFSINPDIAKNSGVIAKSSDQKINVQLALLKGEVYVYYDLNSIILEKTVTITITDQDTQVSDEVTLWFKPSDVIIVPDL